MSDDVVVGEPGFPRDPSLPLFLPTVTRETTMTLTIEDLRQRVAAMYQEARDDGTPEGFATRIALKQVLDVIEKHDPTFWSDPSGNGYVDAWNGYYFEEASAFEASVDGIAGDGATGTDSRVLSPGEELITEDEAEARR